MLEKNGVHPFLLTGLTPARNVRYLSLIGQVGATLQSIFSSLMSYNTAFAGVEWRFVNRPNILTIPPILFLQNAIRHHALSENTKATTTRL